MVAWQFLPQLRCRPNHTCMPAHSYRHMISLTRSHCLLVHTSTQGYVHRDVKPDNVFMACDSALLGDFSLAVGPLVGSSSSAGSHPSTPGRSRFSRCSNDSTSSLTPSSSGSLPESNAAAGSADSESELGSVASLTTSRCSSLLCRSFTVEGRCHAGGTPAYCAPEVVLAAFNSIPMSEALGPHVSSCRRTLRHGLTCK